MIGMGGAVAMALTGYWHYVYIGGLSVFFLLVMIQRFFGDASYAIIGPYIAEVWPNRLRASGMGFSYGIGNLGKITSSGESANFRSLSVVAIQISGGGPQQELETVSFRPNLG